MKLMDMLSGMGLLMSRTLYLGILNLSVKVFGLHINMFPDYCHLIDYIRVSWSLRSR